MQQPMQLCALVILITTHVQIQLLLMELVARGSSDYNLSIHIFCIEFSDQLRIYYLIEV